jgi:hypothetical protein
MKPWEEEWFVVPAESGEATHYGYVAVKRPNSVGLLVEEAKPPVAQLVAAAPEMARLLLQMEWAGRFGYGGESDPACFFCNVFEGYAHKSDCALDAALKKAGVR